MSSRREFLRQTATFGLTAGLLPILIESITANRNTLVANHAIAPGAVSEDKTDVVFSQPDVSDIGERVYVIERRPLGEWFIISWQRSPFTADGKFVPVDWDPGERTGLFIPDEQTRNWTQRGMRNVAGSTVCQMYGGTVGAYLNSADLSGKGTDVNGNPLPGSNGYKQMVTPSYMFGPKETIHPWRTPDSRLQVSLDLQIPTAVCAEKKGSLAYVNPLLTLVAPKTRLKISWGPMLFSKRSRGDATRPLQHIAYDAPSHSWMIRDRLVPGASWLKLAPGSASYQTAPWRGWRHFSWSVSRAHVAAALENMRQQEPQVKVSVDPGDYQLTAFHLNAETHFQTAPAELGWSMRNLRIEVTAGAVCREEIEGTLKANARTIPGSGPRRCVEPGNRGDASAAVRRFPVHTADP
jgi:hypothetical protein